MTLILIAAGVLAGFIDSVAGGGGLVTLPTLGLVLGLGPHAIGTNKIVGMVGALVALLVYARRGHMDWVRGFAFSAWVGMGSLAGSLMAPSIPPGTFRWFLIFTCPLILWIVYRKDLWVAREAPALANAQGGWRRAFEGPVLIAGLACGFYDGVWGPGGGTFMFLALLFVGKFPLLPALAAAKLANTCSAFVALVSYGLRGYVHPAPGLWMASGIAVGAFFGAGQANKRASKIVRPVLAAVVGLLVLRFLVAG